jgi:hypothetical protein
MRKKIKLFEGFHNERDLKKVCSDTLIYILDEGSYELKVTDICANKQNQSTNNIDDDYWLYQVRLESNKIIKSYNSNQYKYIKNSGFSWNDIKYDYLPLLDILKEEIVGYSTEQNKFQNVPTLEFIYKSQGTKPISHTPMLCKIFPITELEKLELDDIWYINLYIVQDNSDFTEEDFHAAFGKLKP